jgi:hypothetical protein
VFYSLGFTDTMCEATSTFNTAQPVFEQCIGYAETAKPRQLF